jgi:hypothetical protein
VEHPPPNPVISPPHIGGPYDAITGKAPPVLPHARNGFVPAVSCGVGIVMVDILAVLLQSDGSVSVRNDAKEV